MRQLLLIFLSLICCSTLSQAGGSIGWVDVKMIVSKTDPELIKVIDRDFEVDRTGGGVRLGPHFGDRQGERIAPFRFGALNLRANQRCVIVIEESEDYHHTGRYKFTVEAEENEDAGKAGL